MKTPFFSFANHFRRGKPKAGPAAGGKTRRTRAEEAPADDKENTDDAEDGTGEEDEEGGEQAEGEEEPDGDEQCEGEDENEDSAEDEEESKPAANSKAARKVRAAERSRIGAIVTSAEAEGRLETALHVALNTNMSVGAARNLLKATPKATAPGTTSRLDAAMGANPRPNIGPSARGGGAKPLAALDAALDAEIARMTKG